MAGAEPPLILTLALDAASEAWLQALRDAHFPAGRNIVPAHVTLFHALPGEHLPAIAAQLAAVSIPPCPVRLGPPRFLGRGVALEVAAPDIAALRARLRAAWLDWLTPQDRQGWRGHATLQNKVAPDLARALFAQLSATLPPREATATGLRLWHYRGGPWEAAGEVPFAA